jgi:hypothetical protein
MQIHYRTLGFCEIQFKSNNKNVIYFKYSFETCPPKYKENILIKIYYNKCI